jgi:hypothetical protein
MIQNDQANLMNALQDVWQKDPNVARFGLRYSPERVEFDYGAWIVPVASGTSTGSAYELAAALTKVQEAVEQKLQAEVTLYLDITGGSPSKNGAH